MNDLRDRIMLAIRGADSHSCMYGEGIDAGDLADAVMAELGESTATCDASIPSIGSTPIGPCILRRDHGGPIHKAASGASWWLNTDPAAMARAAVETVITVQLHDAIRTLARTDPAWWRGELDRMARMAGRERTLG